MKNKIPAKNPMNANINTILGGLILAGILWVASGVMELKIRVSVIEAQLTSLGAKKIPANVAVNK